MWLPRLRVRTPSSTPNTKNSDMSNLKEVLQAKKEVRALGGVLKENLMGGFQVIFDDYIYTYASLEEAVASARTLAEQ